MSITAEFRSLATSELEKLKDDPGLVTKIIFTEQENDDIDSPLNIDKSWQGIEYILENTGHFDLFSLILRGEEEMGQDLGYGPVRYITAENVKGISEKLNLLTKDQLKANYKPNLMMTEHIYPEIWNQEIAWEFLWENFLLIVDYFKQAASKNRAMLTYFI